MGETINKMPARRKLSATVGPNKAAINDAPIQTAEPQSGLGGFRMRTSAEVAASARERGFDAEIKPLISIAKQASKASEANSGCGMAIPNELLEIRNQMMVQTETETEEPASCGSNEQSNANAEPHPEVYTQDDRGAIADGSTGLFSAYMNFMADGAAGFMKTFGSVFSLFMAAMHIAVTVIATAVVANFSHAHTELFLNGTAAGNAKLGGLFMLSAFAWSLVWMGAMAAGRKLFRIGQ